MTSEMGNADFREDGSSVPEEFGVEKEEIRIYDRLFSDKLPTLHEQQIHSSGYVVHTGNFGLVPAHHKQLHRGGGEGSESGRRYRYHSCSHKSAGRSFIRSGIHPGRLAGCAGTEGGD